MTAIPTGYLLYDGPSNLNHKPIIAVATLRSRNRKIGPMVQTWILDRETAPHVAVRTGADASVCGACPLRGAVCYVTMHQAPLSVWRAYQRGAYRRMFGPSYLDGRPVRFGAYGDPCAVPLSVWTEVAQRASRWIGYTHQWRLARMVGFQRLLMASVETACDARIARALGWRTFRVLGDADRVTTSEVTCPNTTHGTACADCLLCDGSNPPGDARKSIAIAVHGRGANMLAEVI